MSAEEHRQVRNIIRWGRIGCIVVKMSERFHVSLTEALDIFYKYFLFSMSCNYMGYYFYFDI